MTTITLTKRERFEKLYRFFIHYPERQRIFDALDTCLMVNEFSNEALGLFIGGISGLGKTTILKSFTKKHSRTEEKERSTIPVLYVSFPSKVSNRNVASRILYAIGDPNYDSGSELSLTTRVTNYIKGCEVKMIILDEFQHIIDKESKKVLVDTANYLKTLLNDNKIPLVLTGLNYSEKVINIDKQLDRRFIWREYVEPFSYDTESQIRDFHTLLDLIDNELPFNQKSGLADPKFAARIHHVTNGTIGLIAPLIQEAARFAIMNDEDKLTSANFSKAYLAHQGKQREEKNSNPFS